MSATFTPSRRTTMLGLAAACVAPASARAVQPLPAGTQSLPAGALREDARLLRRVYDSLHPGLLRYLTQGQAAEAFDLLEAQGAGASTLQAAHLNLSRLLGRIRCGHSYANFHNQSRAVQAALFERPDRLPFQFLWLDGRMIVTAGPGDTVLAPGSEVLSLNGRPAGEILGELLPMARADGANDAKRRRLLSVQGQQRYETFDVFHALMFGSRERHRLRVAGPDGRTRETVVEAISLERRQAQSSLSVDRNGSEPVWAMERRGEAAILTMPTWGLYDSAWDWRTWLNREMDGLVAAGVGRLIVDLRANEGGQDCGDVLAARLTDRPLRPAPVDRLVRYRRIPDDLRPVLDTWDRGFDDWGDQARPFDDRFLILRRGEEVDGEIQPVGPRYQGKVTVLIGPQNSSATFNFAQLMRREALGRLVGETTGGNRRGINGGAFYFVRLPATGLEVDLPLIGQFPPSPQPDAGIEPDMIVPLTAEAVAAGRDPAMEAALA